VEARTEFRGEGISKTLVVVVAVSITMALGVGAGVAAKNLSLTAAPKAHISQGLGGAAQENPARRGGVQIVGANSAAAVKAVGPDDRPTTTKLTPAYQQVDTRGVKSAAISTLQVDTRGIIPAEAFGQPQLAPNSFLGPDARERNAMLAAQSARPTLADARGHRWI
jgi:hypothetical protein